MIPDAHLAALDRLADSGIEVLVATSRRERVVAAAFEAAGIVLPAVVQDGAMAVDLRTGERFHDAPFGADSALAVLDVFARFDLHPCVYVDDPTADVVMAPNPSTCPEHADYLRDTSRTDDLVRAVVDLPVHQFALLGLDREWLDPVATALAVTGAEVVMHREPRYGGWGLIVGPPGVTKWNGVVAYCERSGIPTDAVLAVGDGDNDVEMLERSAVAVAVLGGTERALAAADVFIEPPDRDGWAAIPDLAG